MFIEIVKSHPMNGKRRLVVCNYGYFLKRGKWEMIAINLRPIIYTIQIYRKKEYRSSWPVSCF
jgi:hypothetical protein